MARRLVFAACLLLFSIATMFVAIVILQRLAIGAGSYNPVTDDGYRGTIEDYCGALFRNAVVACAVAAASGTAALITRAQPLSLPR